MRGSRGWPAALVVWCGGGAVGRGSRGRRIPCTRSLSAASSACHAAASSTPSIPRRDRRGTACGRRGRCGAEAERPGVAQAARESSRASQDDVGCVGERRREPHSGGTFGLADVGRGLAGRTREDAFVVRLCRGARESRALWEGTSSHVRFQVYRRALRQGFPAAELCRHFTDTRPERAATGIDICVKGRPKCLAAAASPLRNGRRPHMWASACPSWRRIQAPSSRDGANLAGVGFGHSPFVGFPRPQAGPARPARGFGPQVRNLHRMADLPNAAYTHGCTSASVWPPISAADRRVLSSLTHSCGLHRPSRPPPHLRLYGRVPTCSSGSSGHVTPARHPQ
jgi:hypothetical protein